MTKGTPKTLMQAIQNGVEEGSGASGIEKHVIDYLNNRFQPPMLLGGYVEAILKELLRRIIGRDYDRR